MGPPESATRPRENQAASRRKRRPRLRSCLLKSCEQRFHPRHTRQRYCRAECQQSARRWTRWKAQQRYRETAAGQEKRNGQSRRYRERVKSRKPRKPEQVNASARVITKEHFFRAHVQPAGVLRMLRVPAAKSFAALLFARLSASTGARSGKGTPLETCADLKLEILPRRCGRPYIQPV
jgi:hypothetical protein